MRPGKVIVKMIHVRKAGMCSSGARLFFRKHNLDWSLFLKNGISETELIKTGDSLALRVVEVARGEQ